ncbi:MAG TPA: MBL fold metallo-hydrolase [Lacunisphaera sp.]|nr:MBL fold metallo-hydrolase [Lacunisphaera sp.]
MKPLQVLSIASLVAWGLAAHAQINTVQEVSPGVYFHQGDPRRGHSNNGWVVLDDYVVVIDANYPSGAQEVMPKVKASSPKPVRFVIDTHHHPDHAFGNQLWADAGAVQIAQTNAIADLERSTAIWQQAAKDRPDVAATRLKLPTLAFPELLYFKDSAHPMELHWFGIAHTRGDTFVWLPNEKVLFTGDACVNGAQNFVRDADIASWIKTLDAAIKLGAKVVCPGHGPMGGPEIVVDQQRYFIELQKGVQALRTAGKSPAEVKAAVPALGTELRKLASIARYVPEDRWFVAHVDKVWRELGGEALPP